MSAGEKITLGITILNSLNIFLLLVADINPPTSLATPLICKVILFPWEIRPTNYYLSRCPLVSRIMQKVTGRFS